MVNHRWAFGATTRSVTLSLSVCWSLIVGNLAIGAEIEPGGLSPTIDLQRGLCVVLGLRENGHPRFILNLLDGNELRVFFQSDSPAELAAVRTAAWSAGLLGHRVFVERGNWNSIHLADNLADFAIVASSARNRVTEESVMRVLHPGAAAWFGKRKIVKPIPEGIDYWTHVFHGPDNNPQSRDQLARAPYLTQFLADPKFCPMPEVTVAAGGRLYKAFGHIAHKANQNALLNKLLCVNAFNGTILWSRNLPEGFMIHRNTMVATADALYLGNHESCQVIDGATGQVRKQIVVPDGIADGPVWKWMALTDGILYALVGGQEVNVDTQRSDTPGLGHWPWGMWKGHEYADPRTNFGSGRTFLAWDTRADKLLWTYRENDYVDSRGTCMRAGRIYFYSPEKSLACLDATSGELTWKNSDDDLLEAIGPNEPAQHYVTGYSTTTYIKCNDDYVFFAGPQRSRFVVASTKDGSLAWTKRHGNLQIVLRDDSLYCAGPATTGVRLAYESGDELGKLPTRRACTRATGSVDSVFYRTSGGTVRVATDTHQAEHIAPMRPPCQDGVIISDGLLSWGPWMCGCQLSLYGHICLAPAAGFHQSPATTEDQFCVSDAAGKSVAKFPVQPRDWPTYRGDNRRSGTTDVALPRTVKEQWRFRPSGSTALPTAPVVANGIVFVGDDAGMVRAVDEEGVLRWQAFTGGAIYFPPAVAHDRVYVGAADGRVYALEAATGRHLWSYRVAPGQRWIPVYGKLISTWPVAAGVIVKDGSLYAAAGIAHYDGTYVVALDAITGKPRWKNDSSGAVSASVNSGVSLQGNLYLHDGELRFLAGGVYHTARYDLATGRCLNSPRNEVTSQFRTAFYPYYPDYGQYMSLNHAMSDGRSLHHEASYEGSSFTRLALLEPVTTDAAQATQRDGAQGGRERSAVWRDNTERHFTSFVVAGSTLLAAGVTADEPNSPFLVAVEIENGSELWRQNLSAGVVRGGIAVDHKRRIIVSLSSGDIIGFTGDN